MGGESSSKASSVLGVLADLSPSAQASSSALAVPTDWFRWVPASGVNLFLPSAVAEVQSAPTVSVDRRLGERLAAIDRVRPGDKRSLRAGWLFVAGRRPLGDGRMQRVLHPLLTVPVRIMIPPLLGDAVVRPAGDVSLTELVTDRARRQELEETYELGGGALDEVHGVEIPQALLRRLGRLHGFAMAAARAAGFSATKIIPAADGPEELLRNERLVVVAGVALFTATDVGGLSAAESLRSWASRQLEATTSFHALYLHSDDGTTEPSGEAADDIVSSFPLTPAQLQAVSTSRATSISVVSGAPGTGKSHAVLAIACDSVARGETVLVAAKTEAAVDALLVLLGEAPGPQPVVFGSSERREELARRLATGQLRVAGKAELAEAEHVLREATAARDELAVSIAKRLGAEAYLAGDGDAEDEARRMCPGLFDPSCDLSELRDLLTTAAEERGWWAKRKARKARKRALAIAGASPDASLTVLHVAAEVALQARAVGDLLAAGGLELGPDWARLERLEAQVCQQVGEWLSLSSRSPDRLNRSTLAAVAVLGTALRSGRAARRAQLSRLDNRLTRALPLWVGSLGDVEDLLPPTPGLFDLVVLDEASAIDQPLAAPALLRARRAVVVGDPHQLRHVSFLADDQLRRTAEAHGLDDDPLLVGRLDVRRNSIFDVAVGAAPAIVLEEHFRSAPHLIDFVARRLYRGQLQVATRSPRTEACDCIEVVRMSDARDKTGVVRSEIRQVLERLRQMLLQGERSVGVISPFRAQADALEQAILETFSFDEIEALDLRVGTVHAFQGNERDVVVVSLGVGEGDGAATWRFVQDPHLFAVLATRARRRLVVLLSSPPPSRGLLADYLSEADSPPRRPRPAGAPDPWMASVAEGLRAAGIPTVALYPTGRHTVDVCAGDEKRFLGLECSVHTAGPTAHIERHLALRRAGWELSDAYSSRWGERTGELLVELTSLLQD